MEKPNILYEDRQILVALKEAGVAVQSASIGQRDMESMLKTYLASKSEERIPYLGIVHRLDQPVEGIVVFARTKKAAAALGGQLTADSMEKCYLAVVEKKLSPGHEDVLRHFLKKEKQLAAVADPSDRQAKEARLSYRVLASAEDKSLLFIRLDTGRFHQIRCQLSHEGMPVAGDVRYGGTKGAGRGIALCAWKLSFCHPRTGKRMTFVHGPSGEPFRAFAKEIAGLCAEEKQHAQTQAKGVYMEV